MTHPATFPGLAVLAAALAVAGCGKSQKSAEKVELKQFVVTSAVDCADNTGLTYEVCTELIEEAVASHEKSAPTHKSREACEKAEGPEWCERMDEKVYRPRLTAFQITLSEKPAAVPLYPTKKTTTGFRTASNGDVLTDADTFTFTKSAADAAELYKPQKKKSGL
jgi:uncharacterized protein YgiB involved in biofilm formation